MKYEHLVQMFNPQPVGLTISRSQLWQGLVLRAEDPQRFDENISEARILERSEDVLLREVQFGGLVVREKVIFTELLEVHYHTEPSDQHIGGQMSMRIEEPRPGELFLRFCYINDLPEVPNVTDSNDPSYFVPYLKSAYHQADMQTAKRILELAVEGVLGSS
ncbi:AtaL-like protein [Vogesella oryzae]|uniref:AtaL-like protein n=1 Tax=Vogesella oryzae TaxID=1735285 RepID=UPI0015828985|nr:AtaL-like protein [Vogesella oryzae]